MSIDTPSGEPSLGPVLSRAGARRVDALFAERYGLPTIVLMENAGAALARWARAEFDAAPGRIVILCGPGNNGGDGLVAARHLANMGAPVALVSTVGLDQFRGDAGPNALAVHRMGLPVTLMPDPRGPSTKSDAASAIDAAERAAGGAAQVFIDALLGTGADRPIDRSHPVATLVTAMNARRRCRRGRHPTVIAADLPSGLDADTGEPLVRPAAPGEPAEAVEADLTVTFAGVKRGLRTKRAASFAGRIAVETIGIPAELIETVTREERP